VQTGWDRVVALQTRAAGEKPDQSSAGDSSWHDHHMRPSKVDTQPIPYIVVLDLFCQRILDKLLLFIYLL
jgi:hypothetical protein